jgi:hypothetical protein
MNSQTDLIALMKEREKESGEYSKQITLNRQENAANIGS